MAAIETMAAILTIFLIYFEPNDKIYISIV
jgi:hypothetical protein